jgi:hypothetical protein
MKKLTVALSISFLVVAGCATKNTSNSQSLSNYYSTRTEIAEPKKAEKKWITLVEGSDLMYEDGSYNLSDGGTNFSKREWDNFLKKFIEELPKEKRDAPLRFLMKSGSKNYDELEKRMYFEYATSRNHYKDQRSLGFFRLSGYINEKKDTTINLLLGFDYNLSSIDENFDASSFKVYSDNLNYTQELTFKAYQGRAAGNLGLLDSKNTSFLESIANSEKTTIRFNGRQHYFDYQVSAEDKEELKLALKALKEIAQVSEEKIIPTNNINIQMHEIQHKKKAHK